MRGRLRRLRWGVNMNDLNEILQQLVLKTCSYPKNSANRQQNLTLIIKYLKQSRKLKQPANISTADYDDILQKTWIYLYQNLCEAQTAKNPYVLERSSLLTWINAYLSWRILDHYLEIEREKQRRKFVQESAEGEILDPLDLIPAPTESPPVLKEVLAWLEREKTVLRRICIAERTDIHCELLLRHRLTSEFPWNQLAQKLNVPENTLRGFYNRECLPRLREAGKQLGYIE